MNSKLISFVILFCLLFGGCLGQDSEVVRQINASWSQDDTSVLLVESRYLTSNPSEPYFTATSGSNWSVVLYEATVDKNTLNIQNPKELLRFEEEAQPGGSLQYEPIHWLKPQRKLIGIINQQPFLLDLSKKDPKPGDFLTLKAPDAIVEKIVGGKEQAKSVIGRSPVPSPDGKWVAVFYTFPFRPQGGHFTSLHFTHFVSFFSVESGKHHKSVPLNWPNKETEPFLTPPNKNANYRAYFLWSKDAKGIFVLEQKHAVFVDVSVGSIKKVKEVPEFAIQTTGGKISSEGLELVTQIQKNQAKIVIQKKAGWTPFHKIKMIPLGKQDYTVLSGN